MKTKDFLGILAGIKDVIALVQRNQSCALAVRRPNLNKAAHPTPSGSS